MNSLPTYLFSGAFGVILLLSWRVLVMTGRVLKWMSREESLKADYPPHRHVDQEHIVYPAEYRPAPVESLEHS